MYIQRGNNEMKVRENYSIMVVWQQDLQLSGKTQHTWMNLNCNGSPSMYKEVMDVSVYDVIHAGVRRI